MRRWIVAGRAQSGQETEKPGGCLVAGKAPSFSDGAWTDLHLSNDLMSKSKLNIRCHFFSSVAWRIVIA